MKEEIKLSSGKKQMILSSIKRYFKEERDEEIGDLAASILLDFIVREIAPEFYNQGIEDAYSFMKERTEDMLSLEKVKR